MEFIAEAEVQRGFMKLHVRLRQKELANHFQFHIHLIGIQGFPVCLFELIGQGAFADEEPIRQLLSCEKTLRSGLDQA